MVACERHQCLYKAGQPGRATSPAACADLLIMPVQPPAAAAASYPARLGPRHHPHLRAISRRRPSAAP